jgi:hypothetical protein
MLFLAFVFMAGTTVLSYMGSAEFGVETTADREILNHMTKEPAHNQVGLVLPVPFDQLVPGMYTTRQFEAEGGQAVDAVAALNSELDATIFTANEGKESAAEISVRQLIEAGLTTANSPARSLLFRTIPSGSPELRRVIEEFYDEINHAGDELYNGWGGVVITDNQNNLKRVDVFIVWQALALETEIDENGEERETNIPLRDENGNVIPKLDAAGRPVFLYIDSVKSLSRVTFVHRDSAYFSK